MSPSPDRKQILVVDDEADIRACLDVLLSMEGFQVIAVPDASTAIKALDDFTPHVVLLDYMLPGASPRLVTEKLKARPHTSTVLMTAASDAAQCARELGVERYLNKPFDIDELLELVRTLAHKTGPVLKATSARFGVQQIPAPTQKKASKVG